MGTKAMLPTPESRQEARWKNGAVAYAVLGGVLGLTLGCAGGVARRSTGSAIVAGLCGSMTGTALGAGISWLVLPQFFDWNRRLGNEEPSLLIGLVLHGAVWAAIGAAGGMAFGLGLGERRKLPHAVAGGLIGAIVGTAVYEVIGAALFPLDGTALPVSDTWKSRLLARLAVACGTTLVAALFLSVPDRRLKHTTQPAELAEGV
jgi:hypothetical protein